MKTTLRVSAVASLALLASCIVMPVALAPSTIPLTPGTYTELGAVTGSAVGVNILGFALSEGTQAAKARDRALQQNPEAGALINVACDSSMYLLGPVTVMVTRVSGIAVKLNK